MVDGVKDKFAAGNGALKVTHSIENGKYRLDIAYDGKNKAKLKELLEETNGTYHATHANEKFDIADHHDNSITLVSRAPAMLKPGNGGHHVSHYYEHRQAEAAITDLQDVLSRKEFSIPVEFQGHKDNLHVTASVREKDVVVSISLRKYDREPKNIMDATIGRGNDKEKVPLALGIIQKLNRIATQSMQPTDDYVPASSFTCENLINHSVDFKVNSYHSTTVANRILASLSQELEGLEQNGLVITGNHAEKVAGKVPSTAELAALKERIEAKVTALAGNTADAMRASADIFNDVRSSLGISGPKHE